MTQFIAKYFKKEEGLHANLALEDCTQICATSTDFMLRGSDMHSSTYGVCAEVCERCAQSCREMAQGGHSIHNARM